jgi:hypothetical protein
LNIFLINKVILETKHENSIVNQIVLEQEQKSETKKNQIKLLEAEIGLLVSKTNENTSNNTQESKDKAAELRAVEEIGN